MAKRHLSVEKRARQNIQRNRRNRTIKSAMRGALKKVAINTDRNQAAKLICSAQSALDHAVTKRVIKANKAARLKSRLMRKSAVSSTGTAAE